MLVMRKKDAKGSSIHTITTADGKFMGTVGRVNDLFSNGMICQTCTSEIMQNILENDSSWLCMPDKEYGSCPCYGDTMEKAIINAIAS